MVRLVRLTASHDPDPDDVTGAVLCDADLSILAAAADRYAQYAAAIRQEYIHIPRAEFCAGRAKVLQSFLDRPAIYRTPHGQQYWEAAARANLANEIAQLTALQLPPLR